METLLPAKDISGCKTFTLDELHAPDLKSYSYEFPSVGYCPLGADYNVVRAKVTLVPDGGTVPDASFVSAQIRAWRGTCVAESTEGRAQQFLDYFWKLCRPKHIRVEFGSAGSSGTMIHSCILEKVKEEVRA